MERSASARHQSHRFDLLSLNPEWLCNAMPFYILKWPVTPATLGIYMPLISPPLEKVLARASTIELFRSRVELADLT